MRTGYRYLSSLFLTAALAVPVATMAAAIPQDNRNQEDRRGENKENRQGENQQRYYDRSHKDYHTWDRNEDHAYQRYQTQHHQDRPFIQLSTRQQTGYWNWRHSNPDNR